MTTATSPRRSKSPEATESRDPLAHDPIFIEAKENADRLGRECAGLRQQLAIETAKPIQKHPTTGAEKIVGDIPDEDASNFRDATRVQQIQSELRGKESAERHQRGIAQDLHRASSRRIVSEHRAHWLQLLRSGAEAVRSVQEHRERQTAFITKLELAGVSLDTLDESQKIPPTLSCHPDGAGPVEVYLRKLMDAGI